RHRADGFCPSALPALFFARHGYWSGRLRAGHSAASLMDKALSYSPSPARPLDASDRTWFREANRAGMGSDRCRVPSSLDASSTALVGAGEGNRTLVISLEGTRRFHDIKANSDILCRFAALSAKLNFRLSECPSLKREARPFRPRGALSHLQQANIRRVRICPQQ